MLLSCAAAARVGWTVYKFHQGQKKAQQAVEEAAARAAALRSRFRERVQELLHGTTGARLPKLDGEFPCVFATVTPAAVRPEVGKCAMPTKPSRPVDRFEVDLRYGNFILRQSDLYIQDIFDVPLTRTYNSGDYIHPNRVHAFGKNTNHPYDIGPLGTRNPYTYSLIILEDGDFLFFDRVSEGVGFADAIYQHTETSTRFYRAVTAWNGNGWTTWLADGSSIQFPEAYRSTNMAQCAAVEMRDGQGNALKLLRDPQGNLLEIRTPHQHSMKFHYDENSRIIRAQDEQGNWARYQYNEDGLLDEVDLSSGHERHYSYDGLLMTSIEDESHKVLLRNFYEKRALTRQDFGNGQVYSYVYTWSANGHYAMRVVVTLPDRTRITADPENSVPDRTKSLPG